MIARENPLVNLGGDSVQALKTKAELERLGVDVDMLPIDELDGIPEYDVAHIFNIQMPEATMAAYDALQRRNIPIVLSSIYWDMIPHWYELAVTDWTKWRWLSLVLGKKAAGKVYIARQHKKESATDRWRAQRNALARAERVLPNSRIEADLLQAMFDFDDSFHQKVDVVPNGIDADDYGVLPQPDAGFLEEYGVRDFVLQVGAIYPAKNQLELIEALFDLPAPLVFIGRPRAESPEYTAACHARAEARGNVTFVDHVPNDELPGIYALAAVHALPSWRETPGLVSLEAAAAGCRVVSTSIGSAYEYFGDMAQYCQPNDRSSIRNAVRMALESDTQPALREAVLAKYTWRRAAEVTLQSYRRACARG